MGCVWSDDERPTLRCRECGRKAVNNLIIVNQICEICRHHSRGERDNTTRNQISYSVVRTTNITTPLPTISRARTSWQSARPLYGEFRCICGRAWSSRLTWVNNYQVCKHCRRNVKPHTQRELRDSDRAKDSNKLQEHPRELCQKCKSLGRYCGKTSKK